MISASNPGSKRRWFQETNQITYVLTVVIEGFLQREFFGELGPT